jgi:DNA-binding transcriptional LysR family regulator
MTEPSMLMGNMKTHAARLPTAVASLQQLAWDDLRIFLALAESNGTRVAAKSLGINASTVSRRVSALERSIGTRLFLRNPEGLRLSTEGQEILGAVKQMELALRGVASRVANADQKLAGKVRVSVAEIVAGVVCETLRQVCWKHPKLQLELQIGDGMVDVERHETDLVVRVSNSPPEQLLGRKLGRAQVAIYGSRSYLQAFPYPLESPKHRWVEWPSYVHKKDAYAWFEREYPNRQKCVTAASTTSVFTAVAEGLGLAILPCVQARTASALVELQKLPENCGTDVWVLWHPDAKENARVRVIAEALRELGSPALNGAR